MQSLNHFSDCFFLATVFRTPILVVVSALESVPVDCPSVSFGLRKENYQIVSSSPLEKSAILYRVLEYLISRHSFAMKENVKVTRLSRALTFVIASWVGRAFNIIFRCLTIFVDHAHQTFFGNVNVAILGESPILLFVFEELILRKFVEESEVVPRQREWVVHVLDRI